MTDAMPKDNDCIFCKIAAGQIPAHMLYEDDHVISFLDIGPLSEGHTLVIPRGHWVTLDQVPEDVMQSIGRALRRIGAAVAAAIDCDGWNVLQNNGRVAGQVVMHVHFHIIPRREGDSLGYRWPAGQLDDETASKLSTAIRGALQ
jgi:histidine triad (HIT) family protein